jgi:hypothetical protein
VFPADANPTVLFTKNFQDKMVWQVERIVFSTGR